MKKIFFLTTIISLFFLISCDEEDRDIPLFTGPQFVGFNNANQENTTGYSLSEGGTITVEISMTEAFSEDVTLNLSTTDDTAIQGTHYSLSSNTVVIPAGQFVGSLEITATDDDVLNDARNFTLNIDSVSSNLEIGNGDINSGSALVSIINDDCPVRTSLWWGTINIEDVGQSNFTGTGSANADGDCDILIVDANLPNAGATADGGPYPFIFTPNSEGATAGTVNVPATIGCTACSAGLDGLYSGNGTYDENTGMIVIFYSFDRSDGANFFTGTEIITIP